MKRTTELQRRTPMRQRSKRTARTYTARRRLVAAMLEPPTRCAAGERTPPGTCTGRATQVHEPLTRARGGSILDPANCLPVCAACHRWVHDHDAEATAVGLLEPSHAN